MTRPQRPCWKYLCRGLGGPTHLDFKSDWAFRARAYCSENSRARARRLTLRKIGRKFGRCLRANQVANQPAQTADSVRTSLRTAACAPLQRYGFAVTAGVTATVTRSQQSAVLLLTSPEKCAFAGNRLGNHALLTIQKMPVFVDTGWIPLDTATLQYGAIPGKT